MKQVAHQTGRPCARKLAATAALGAGLLVACAGAAAQSAKAPAGSKIPDIVRNALVPYSSEITAPATPTAEGEVRAVQTDTSGNIYLQIHSASPITASEIGDVKALGATVTTSTQDIAGPTGYYMIQSWVPSSQLDALSALPWVTTVRPVHALPPDVGPNESEGVPLHAADIAHANGVTGRGFTVGAISDGVTSIAASQAAGELPPAVLVLNAGAGDEGTAMLEIVHDMAPGAGLAFHGTGNGPLDHIAAQNNLVAAGIDVLTEDIAFDDEPAFQRGAVATNGDDIAANGVSVHSSAGNRGQQHAERVPAVGTGHGPDGFDGPFTGCPTVNPLNVVDIDPGPGTCFDVTINGSVLFTLQWSEPRSIFPTPGAGGFTDLDLYVMDSTGTACAGWSLDPQGSGQGDTIEQIGGTAVGNFKLCVNVFGSFGAVAPPTLDLRWRGAVTSIDTPTRAGSLNPDSNYIGLATSSAAAGADVTTDPTTVPLEPFSSGGPVDLHLTTVCPGGVYPCPNNGVAGDSGTTRNAPDWTSANGVQISGAGGFGAGTCPADTPGDCRFFGTSASAPHSAACDALVREAGLARPLPLTVEEIYQAMARSATDRGLFGDDPSWGAGVLNCAKAANSVLPRGAAVPAVSPLGVAALGGLLGLVGFGAIRRLRTRRS